MIRNVISLCPWALLSSHQQLLIHVLITSLLLVPAKCQSEYQWRSSGHVPNPEPTLVFLPPYLDWVPGPRTYRD